MRNWEQKKGFCNKLRKESGKLLSLRSLFHQFLSSFTPVSSKLRDPKHFINSCPSALTTFTSQIQSESRIGCLLRSFQSVTSRFLLSSFQVPSPNLFQAHPNISPSVSFSNPQYISVVSYLTPIPTHVVFQFKSWLKTYVTWQFISYSF